MAASSGTEGIEKALWYEPDLIVCDIAMPETDGFQVIKTLRGFEHLRSVKIICISAQHNISASSDFGADAYMSIPVSLKELIALANQLLRENQPR